MAGKGGDIALENVARVHALAEEFYQMLLFYRELLIEALSSIIIIKEKNTVFLSDEMITFCEVRDSLRRVSQDFAQKKLTTIRVKPLPQPVTVVGALVEDREIICCSDTHNDYFSSEVAVFHSGFFEAPEKFLLLNLGDYIGRGKMFFRNLFFWLSLKSLFPQSVVLLKGNHELEKLSGDLDGLDVPGFFEYGYDSAVSIMNLLRQLPVAFLNFSSFQIAVHGAVNLPTIQLSPEDHILFLSLFENEVRVTWSEFSDEKDSDGSQIERRTRGIYQKDLVYVGPRSIECLSRKGITTIITGHVHRNEHKIIERVLIANVATHSLISPHVNIGLTSKHLFCIHYLIVHSDGALLHRQIDKSVAQEIALKLKLLIDYFPTDNNRFESDIIESYIQTSFYRIDLSSAIQLGLHYLVQAVNLKRDFGSHANLLKQYYQINKESVVAEINKRDRFGFTPSHLVTLYGRESEVFLFLQEIQADFHERDLFGNTTIHLLMFNDGFNFAEFILLFDRFVRWGVDYNAINNQGKTFLDLILTNSFNGWKLLIALLNRPRYNPVNIFIRENIGSINEEETCPAYLFAEEIHRASADSFHEIIRFFELLQEDNLLTAPVRKQFLQIVDESIIRLTSKVGLQAISYLKKKTHLYRLSTPTDHDVSKEPTFALASVGLFPQATELGQSDDLCLGHQPKCAKSEDG